jgi:hypothetical protein
MGEYDMILWTLLSGYTVPALPPQHPQAKGKGNESF